MAIRAKIVITDHRFPSIEKEQKAVAAEGWNLVVGQVSDESALIELCSDADAILAGRAHITERVLAAMKRCRVIVRYGIGIETIDVNAATDHGIMVANVPDYCIDEVSDHALALLLMLSRQILPALAIAKRGPWSVAGISSLRRLRGSVCGLFGFGRIGSLLAKKTAALGMEVVVFDPYLSDQKASDLNVERISFDQLLKRSDFISLHAPLTDETRHAFGRDAFLTMKKSSYLINTARGGLIDEPALIAALEAGDIAGAAMDVIDAPFSTQQGMALIQNPKTIVTPHSAWLSEEAREAMQAGAIRQVVDCLKGAAPYGLINTTVQPRSVRET